MRNVRWALLALALVVLVGANAVADEEKNTDPTTPDAQKKIELLRRRLPNLAHRLAHSFSHDSDTAELTVLELASCTQPGYPKIDGGYVSLGSCNFVFKRGAKETTFNAKISSSVILKGEEDQSKPLDPQTKKYPPAKISKVVFPGMLGVHVSAGAAPALPRAVALKDDKGLDDYARVLVNRQEVGKDTDPKNKVDQFSRANDEDCGEFDDEPEIKDPKVKRVCWIYNQDRWNGQLVVDFQVENEQYVGVRWVGFGGNF